MVNYCVKNWVVICVAKTTMLCLMKDSHYREWEWEGMGMSNVYRGKRWELEQMFGWHGTGNGSRIETYGNATFRRHLKTFLFAEVFNTT